MTGIVVVNYDYSMKIYSKNSGFTLIELMVVMIIGAILVAAAIPNFQTLLMNNRMTSVANEVLGAVSFARMEAVKRGRTVHLGRRDGSSWVGGIVVWSDADGDNTWDTGEEIRLWSPLHNESTLTSTQTRLIFNALGRVDNGNTFTLCDSRTGETGRVITLLSSGAVSIKKQICE